MISLKSLNTKLSSLEDKLTDFEQKYEDELHKLCAYLQQLTLALNSVAGEDLVNDQNLNNSSSEK